MTPFSMFGNRIKHSSLCLTYYFSDTLFSTYSAEVPYNMTVGEKRFALRFNAKMAATDLNELKLN